MPPRCERWRCCLDYETFQFEPAVFVSLARVGSTRYRCSRRWSVPFARHDGVFPL